MKIKSSFVETFGDTPINRLWEFLIDSRGLFDYSKTDICESADISWNTLEKIFPHFVKSGIVKETRKIGRATMYMLNEDHPKATFMIGMHKAISMVFAREGDVDIEITVSMNGDSIPVRMDLTEPMVKPIY